MSDHLALLIQAGHPLLLIETTDEDRAEDVVRETAAKLQRIVCDWSLTKGLWQLDDGGRPVRNLAPAGKPAAVASPCTRAITGCGNIRKRCMTREQRSKSSR